MNASMAEFRVPEVIRFDNAVAVRAAGERFLEQGDGPARISLAALRENNSVVVALLLAWARHAMALGRTLRVVDVPADLRNIIELYGVAGILPLEEGASGSVWIAADRDSGESAEESVRQENR